jgi:hypothetical protein
MMFLPHALRVVGRPPSTISRNRQSSEEEEEKRERWIKKKKGKSVTH